MRKSNIIIMVLFIVFILVLIPIFGVKNGNKISVNKYENIPIEDNIEQSNEEQTTKNTSDNINEENIQNINNEESNSSQFRKIGENLYFNINSFSANDGFNKGIFIEYFPQSITKFGKSVKYKSIQVSAFCNIQENGGIKKIDYPIYKFYDIMN